MSVSSGWMGIVVLIGLIAAAGVTVEAAAGDLLPQSNTPAVAQSSTARGVVTDGSGDFFTCQGTTIYKTTTLTGASFQFYTGAALDACRALAISSNFQYLYATGATNVYRFDLTNGKTTSTKVVMNTGANPFDSTSTGVTPNLSGLTIDGAGSLFVFNNAAVQANRHAWTLQAWDGTPGAWTMVTDGRTDLGNVESITTDFVLGYSAKVLIFSQGVSGASVSAIGVINLSTGTCITNFGGSIFPAGQPIYGLTPLRTEPGVVTLLASFGTSSAFRAIAVVFSTSTTTISDYGPEHFSTTFTGTVFSSYLDSYYGTLVFVTDTNVFRVISSTFTFYSSTKTALLGDVSQIYTKAFWPPSLTTWNFNVTSSVTDGSPNSNTPIQFTVEAGSSVMYYTYQPPTPTGSSGSVSINFAIQATRPNQWSVDPSSDTMDLVSVDTTSDSLRCPVDRASTFDQTKFLYGATNITADESGENVYILNGRAINKLVTATGVITSLCTAGTNGPLVGFVIDDAYIYAIDTQLVYRCSLVTGGALAVYSVGGASFNTPLMGITRPTSSIVPLLYVTGGDNVQSVFIDSTANVAPVSGPLINSGIDYDNSKLIVCSPDGTIIFITGQRSGTGHGGPNTGQLSLFKITFDGPILNISALPYGTVSQYSSTGSYNIVALSIDWTDTYQYVFVTNYGVTNAIYGCNVNQDACSLTHQFTSGINIVSMATRGKGSLFALTIDTDSTISTLAAPRIERISERNFMVGYGAAQIYPYSSYAYTNQTNTIRINLNPGDAVLEGQASVTVECRDQNDAIVNDPSIVVTATEHFDFNFYPTVAGSVNCRVTTFHSRDLIRVGNLAEFINSPVTIQVVDLAAEVNIQWLTIPLFAGNSKTFSWSLGDGNYLEGNAALVITCTGGIIVTPPQQCLSFGRGEFVLSGGVNGANTTCTATVTGLQASVVTITNPISNELPILAQRTFMLPMTSSSSPMIVPAYVDYYPIDIYRQGNNTQTSSVYVQAQCGARGNRMYMEDGAYYSPGTDSDDRQQITFWLDLPGLSSCSFSYQYGSSDDEGMYAPLPDMFFKLGRSDIQMHVSGLPNERIDGSNITSTVITLSIANPVVSNDEQLTLDLNCNLNGYDPGLIFTTGSSKNDPSILLGGGNQITFNGSSSVGGAAVFNITVGMIPVGSASIYNCYFSRSGSGSAIVFDNPSDPYQNKFTFYIGQATALSWTFTPASLVYYTGSTHMHATIPYPSSMNGYQFYVFDCFQNGASFTGDIYAGFFYWSVDEHMSAFSMDDRNLQPMTLDINPPETGLVQCKLQKYQSIRNSQWWFYQFIVPDFNFTVLPLRTFTVSGVPPIMTGGSINFYGSLTQATVFNITAQSLPISGMDDISLRLSCSYYALVTPTFLFNTNSTANIYTIEIPALATADDSFGTPCSWDIVGGSLSASYVAPDPFTIWVGLNQRQLTATIDSGSSSTVVVGSSSYFTLSAASGNVFSSELYLSLSCIPCVGTNTGDLSSGMNNQQVWGTFPSASNANGYVSGNAPGQVTCSWSSSGADAPHFIVPADMTFTVVAQRDFNVQITGGPITPITVTGSTLNTPTAIAPQSGATSVFNVTIDAPMSFVGLELSCNEGTVTPFGGDSISSNEITWLNTTTSRGVWVIEITNNLVDGVAQYCYFNGPYDVDSYLYRTPQDFSFYVGPTIQLVTILPTVPLYASEWSLPITITTPTVNSTTGFSLNMACKDDAGSSLDVSQSTTTPSFSNDFKTETTVTVLLNKPGMVTCSFTEYASGTEYRRFLVPEPFTLNFLEPISWIVSVGGSVVDTTNAVINVPSGTGSIAVIIEPSSMIPISETAHARLFCQYDNSNGVEISPSPYLSFTFGHQAPITLNIQLPQANTIVSTVSAGVACTWDQIQLSRNSRFVAPATFTVIVGPPITLTLKSLNPNTIVYNNPLDSQETRNYNFELVPSSCPSEYGQVAFQVDCGYGRGYWVWDSSGNQNSLWYGVNDQISFTFTPTQYSGPVMCRVSVSGQRIDGWATVQEITINVVQRASWIITGVPDNVPFDGSFTVMIAPSVPPTGTGVLAYMGDNDFFPDNYYYYWPPGDVTPQAVKWTAYPGFSSFQSGDNGAYFYVYGYDYSDMYAYADAYAYTTMGPVLHDRSNWTLVAGCPGGAATVDVTVTLDNPFTDISLTLQCVTSYSDGYDSGANIDYHSAFGESRFVRNGALTQTITVSNLQPGNYSCYWSSSGGGDKDFFQSTPFIIQVGEQLPFIFTPAVTQYINMLPNTRLTYQVLTPVPVGYYRMDMNPKLTPKTSNIVIDSGLNWVYNQDSSQPRSITIYAPNQPEQATMDLLLSGYSETVAKVVRPAPFTITVSPMYALTLTPVASPTTYSGSSIPITITPTITVPLQFSVQATCTGAVTLESSTINFVTGSASSLSFMLVPSDLTPSTTHPISCSFTTDGPGTDFISGALNAVTFDLAIPAQVPSSTGGATGGTTGSTTGTTGGTGSTTGGTGSTTGGTGVTSGSSGTNSGSSSGINGGGSDVSSGPLSHSTPAFIIYAILALIGSTLIQFP